MMKIIMIIKIIIIIIMIIKIIIITMMIITMYFPASLKPIWC